jgi:hypothetical protein
MGNEKYPTIAQVLPFFNLLLHKQNVYLGCRNLSEKPNFITLEASGKPKVLTNAVYMSRKKLAKYFHMADSAESLHSIATSNKFRKLPKIIICRFFSIHEVLDPRFKLEYFKQAGWPDRKIKQMKLHAMNLWASLYKPVMSNETSKRRTENNPAQSIAELLWSVCSSQVISKPNH